MTRWFALVLSGLAVIAVIAGAFVLAPARQVSDDRVAEGPPQSFRGCVACHVIRSPDGVLIAGNNGRTGPNLYGIFGAPAASVAGFRYRSGLEKVGEEGLVWDQETLVAYLQDPTGFLREQLDDPNVRSAMVFRVRDPGEAEELAAYLAEFPAR